MFGVKLLLGALVALSAFFYQSDAATCTAFTTQQTCTQSTICAWSSSVGCYCNVATNLEVVFVMDSSGSVKDWGWTSEKNFVKSVVTTGLSPGTYVGIVVFSDGSSTKYKFNQDQTRSKIEQVVNNLGFANGATYTLSGVNDALNVYKTTTKHLPRIMFLITDGNPNPWDTQNPCSDANSAAAGIRSDLVKWNISTLLITVGPDVNAGTLSCLYGNDPSRVIPANNFTSASLAAIRAKTDSFLCPTNSDLRIGEVRVNVSTGDNPGGKSRFVELYNHGQFIDFAGNNLKLSGYVTGTISTGGLKKGQRLVVYDKTGTAGSDLQCNSCTCPAEETNTAGTLSSGKCSNAIYMGCGDSGVSCTFDTRMSNSRWSQKVTDTLDGAVWVDVSHNSATNNLATVYEGFTFEVVNILQDTSTGANWKRSCTMYGTPGSVPLTSCSATCINEMCRGSGDTGATCSNGVCDCTASNHYYSDQYQCAILPPPTNCKTYISKQGGAQYATVAWSAAGTSLTHQYAISFTFEGAPSSATTATGSGITYYVYGGAGSGINPVSDPVPTVKTRATVNNELVDSVSVSCPFVTVAPSKSPTKSPTLRPTARPTRRPTTRPTLRPTARPTTRPTLRPTRKPTLRPTGNPTVSGYTITSCEIFVHSGTSGDVTFEYTLNKLTTVSDTDEDLSLELSVDTLPASGTTTGIISLDPAAGSPQDATFSDPASYSLYYLWPRYRIYPISGAYTGNTRGVACSVTTVAPTPAPTKLPTPPTTATPSKSPSAAPTKKPTTRPTAGPTYESLAADACVITLGRADSTGEVTSASHVFTEPTYNYPTTPASDNVVYVISWGSGGTGEKIAVAAKGSGSQNSGNAKNLVISATASVVITAYTSNPTKVAGPSVACTLLTLAPTPAPTSAPHPPTPAPILPDISLVVDIDRCTAGTVDNAGRDVYICKYEVSQGAYTVNVELATGSFSSDVNFGWQILFDHTTVEPNYDGSDPIAPRDDFGVIEDIGTIKARETTAGISLAVNKKTDADADAEVAWLTLYLCTFGDDENSCSVAGSSEDVKTFRIEIIDEGGQKQESSNSLGNMPTWIWYPIAAGILILAGLAAFGYMYYNKRKLAEEQLQRREADLANAEELDNMENFGGLGDNINFNPIATAGTQDVATGGEYIDKQLAKQQKHAEFAQVDVDKEVWRQDFGQIKADRHDV